MAYITNFSNFTPEECGLIFPNQPSHYPRTTTIQKSSVNTIDSFCLNPYGAVSNLDCPDWDPACNCWITQFMPEKREPPGISLEEYKAKISECSLIQEHLKDQEWMGVDYSNPYCQYNCIGITGLAANPNLNPVPVDTYKIDGSSIKTAGATFPYSLGLSGISGVSLITEYRPDQVADGLTSANWKTCGSCFPYYLEYSKTNATFWNTSPKTPLLRKGQIGAYNSQKIKILVNGQQNVKVGMMVNIAMPIGDETKDKLTQKRFSGRWFIYRIERVITTFKHSMYLYLMRDGYSIQSKTSPTLDPNATGSRKAPSGV